MVADRPNAVAALTKIFLDAIERLLCAAAGGKADHPGRPGLAHRRGQRCVIHFLGRGHGSNRLHAAHDSLGSRAMLAEVPLAGLSVQANLPWPGYPSCPAPCSRLALRQMHCGDGP